MTALTLNIRIEIDLLELFDLDVELATEFMQHRPGLLDAVTEACVDLAHAKFLQNDVNPLSKEMCHVSLTYRNIPLVPSVNDMAVYCQKIDYLPMDEVVPSSYIKRSLVCILGVVMEQSAPMNIVKIRIMHCVNQHCRNRANVIRAQAYTRCRDEESASRLLITATGGSGSFRCNSCRKTLEELIPFRIFKTYSIVNVLPVQDGDYIRYAIPVLIESTERLRVGSRMTFIGTTRPSFEFPEEIKCKPKFPYFMEAYGMTRCQDSFAPTQLMHRLINHKSQFSELNAGKAALLGSISSTLQHSMDILFVTEDALQTRHQITLALPKEVKLSPPVPLGKAFDIDSLPLQMDRHLPLFIEDYTVMGKSLQKSLVNVLHTSRSNQRRNIWTCCSGKEALAISKYFHLVVDCTGAVDFSQYGDHQVIDYLLFQGRIIIHPSSGAPSPIKPSKVSNACQERLSEYFVRYRELLAEMMTFQPDQIPVHSASQQFQLLLTLSTSFSKLRNGESVSERDAECAIEMVEGSLQCRFGQSVNNSNTNDNAYTTTHYHGLPSPCPSTVDSKHFY